MKQEHRVIDYEAEYNNRALVPEHPALIEGWKRDAAAYRAEAHCDLAIPYGELSERTTYDLFLPEDSMPAAAHRPLPAWRLLAGA
ncbi:MAG: hypothetical protein HPM95_02525 [Alphaproteobacteria bacterium]|nr:hypothetical protein [Alphaproteobacteria bacterium]